MVENAEYRNMAINAMRDMLCDVKERLPLSDLYYTSYMEEF